MGIFTCFFYKIRRYSLNSKMLQLSSWNSKLSGKINHNNLIIARIISKS